MEKFDLYQDIATRTEGNIYIGVVGPVRSGKSTFITKFMQTMSCLICRTIITSNA